MFRLNRLESFGQPLEPEDAQAFGPQAARQVHELLALCPAHHATSLRVLPAMAAHLRLAHLYVKDESTRLGLGSFKALGGAYAVLRVVLEEAAARLGRPVLPEELRSMDVRAIAREITVCCATDGNHGRAVAAGARFMGCRAVIFLHATVSAKRATAIEELGGSIRRIDGHYQAAVAAAARAAAEQNWTLVSDTSWSGYERIPRLVAQGYTAMLHEVIDEMPRAPTHVFVQAGVGGLAAAVAAHLACVYGTHRPRIIVVEPSRAACLYESVRAGKPVTLPGGEPTIMAMLDCQEPSLVAWRVLAKLADAFMTVEEEDAIRAMRMFARPLGEDPAIVAGESGGVGLAGLVKALGTQGFCDAVGLRGQANVLLLNTEGATDPSAYEAIVGASPDAVRSSATRHAADVASQA